MYDEIDAIGKFSLFRVANAGVILNINNVSINNAVINDQVYATQNASVLDIVAQDAKVTLNNVVLSNNGGNLKLQDNNADAIYNAGSLFLNGVKIEFATSGNTVTNLGSIEVDNYSFPVDEGEAYIIHEKYGDIEVRNILGTDINNIGEITFKAGSSALIGGDVTGDGVIYSFGTLIFKGAENNELLVEDQQVINLFSGSNLILDNAILTLSSGGIITSDVLNNEVNIEINNANLTYKNLVAEDIKIQANSGILVLDTDVADATTSLSLNVNSVFESEISIALRKAELILNQVVNPDDNSVVANQVEFGANDFITTDAQIVLNGKSTVLTFAKGVNNNNIVELTNSNITGNGRLNNNGANIIVSSDQATLFTGDFYQYGDSSTAKLDVMSVIVDGNEVSNVFSGSSPLSLW